MSSKKAHTIFNINFFNAIHFLLQYVLFLAAMSCIIEIKTNNSNLISNYQFNSINKAIIFSYANFLETIEVLAAFNISSSDAKIKLPNSQWTMFNI